MKPIIAILLSGCMLLAASCGIGARKGQNPAEWPYFFEKLMDAAEMGAYYEEALKQDDYVTFSLSDGEDICLEYSAVKIIDCNIFDFPQLSVDSDEGKWTINNVLTDVYDDSGKSNRKSYPLCACYDNSAIYLVLSNGETVKIGKSPETCLKSFSILAKDNPRINSDIVFNRDGFTLVGEKPQIKNKWTLVLVPRFEYDGLNITVNGETQESGKSWQDFSLPVEYDIERNDGTHVLFTVTLESSYDCPTVNIITEVNPNQITKDSYVQGRIIVEDPQCIYGDVRQFEASMKIKGRGNSTWTWDKKPYHIKLDEKASVFGLTRNRDWLIMANYNDKSLLRNRTAMLLSRMCGLSWSPHFLPVEVYFNGVYWGEYDFAEDKEVAKDRVDINIVNSGDNSGEAVTGGYYLELECYPDEANYFWTDMKVPLTFKDPEYPTANQKAYLIGWFKEFEAALQSDSFADPAKGYAKYIDVKSFIDNYIIQELTKNFDGNLHKSTFFTKERNGKLEFYHVWDFDLSLGNCSFFSKPVYNGPENFYVKDYGFQGYGYGWYYRLFQDPVFKKKVKNRWNELMPQLETVPDSIRVMADNLELMQERNFQRWDVLKKNIWSQVKVPGTYSGEIEYMIDFYENRLQWLNKEINKW